MFSYFKQIVGGGRICFSSSQSGCAGASCYLGFTAPSKDAGLFLAETEHFKKSVVLGNTFYEAVAAEPAAGRFMVWESLENLDDDLSIEVVNLWINPESLSRLVTLANYDRADNDNVLIPFASGCQSIWTLPYKERNSKQPKGIVGGMDPAVRQFLPADTLSFSAPCRRAVAMADHVPGSFLEKMPTN
jgi:hypothetical protein